MKSYILQIDGTTDSEFSTIIAVRDAISDFVLHVKRCHSESQESIENILQSVKDSFGVPSGITSDMRDGILSAAGIVFPHTPIRICLMHFLRDLGKDLMENMHTDLGKMINGAGIRSPLKALLRNMPDYRQGTLDEIESGYCSSPGRMEIMAIRKVLEALVHVDGASGRKGNRILGHLNFFTACEEAMRRLSDLIPALSEMESRDVSSAMRRYLTRITDNTAMVEKAHELREINSIIFQRIRRAFMIPEKGNLSEDDRYEPLTDDPMVHEQCSMVFGELEVYLNSNIGKHLFTAAKLALERYRKREAMLFARNPDGTIPRTNNGMETFFRNMGHRKYREIVFGFPDIGSVFAKHRKPFRKEGTTGKKIMELVEKGTEMIIQGSLHDSPYSEEIMNLAYSSRNNPQTPREGAYINKGFN